MNFVAIKMLTGDRAKYLGLIFAMAFSSFLLENQSSIFAGILDFLTVLDNERSVYAAEDQLAQSDRTLVVSLIAIYKALGGWWEAMPTPEVTR